MNWINQFVYFNLQFKNNKSLKYNGENYHSQNNLNKISYVNIKIMIISKKITLIKLKQIILQNLPKINLKNKPKLKIKTH